MKENTRQSKAYLEKALKSMPNDFSLFDARRHMKIALNKINEIEKKRNKRENLKEQKKLKLNANSIFAINSMIEEEKKKIEDLER